MKTFFPIRKAFPCGSGGTLIFFRNANIRSVGFELRSDGIVRRIFAKRDRTKGNGPPNGRRPANYAGSVKNAALRICPARGYCASGTGSVVLLTYGSRTNQLSPFLKATQRWPYLLFEPVKTSAKLAFGSEGGNPCETSVGDFEGSGEFFNPEAPYEF